MLHPRTIKRALQTLNMCLSNDREWLPFEKSAGNSTNGIMARCKAEQIETAEKYGEAQVEDWAQIVRLRPPLLEESDPRNPARLEQYRGVFERTSPARGSLADTIARTVPY